MTEFAIMAALLSPPLLIAAWREFRDDNRRDAALLGSLGTISSASALLASLG